jgi:hypothetical protein
VFEKFGLRTLRAAEIQFKKPSAESDDPATLPAIKHDALAALADSTWMAKESITLDSLRKIVARDVNSSPGL